MNLEKRLKEIEERKLEIRKQLETDSAIDLDSVEKELNELETEARGIKSKISLAEKIQAGETEARKIEQLEVKVMDLETIRSTKEYRSAFFKKLLGRPLTEAEQRAAAATYNTTSAGAVIPTETAEQIFEKMKQVAPMLDEITLLRVAGNVKFAVENNRDIAGIHDENTAINVAQDALATVSLTGYEYAKLIRVSKTVSTMAIDAFETWLVNMLAEDIARAIEHDIINGSGSGEPKGIDASNTWVYTAGATQNGIEIDVTANAELDFAAIMDLIALLPNGYMSNAKFLCNSRMFYSELAKISDADGMPIYVKNVEQGVSFRVMGFPVILSDYVAADTLYFGDFTKMVGNLSQDISVESSTESGFVYNAIDFRGTAIFDCNVAVPEAIKKLYIKRT